ncbi:unnamed protein product [Sphenostylis stenocarpa]|uniref:Uncharacterized protein n=1 Tax=Sphenostylis stenocarpa TaxID=92480 RepID=A0AA86SX65_9FABA|nr:unnamed protein product [Sphenostylis stenocarpa]
MMNKMHCSSNSKSLWNDPASRSRRAFSTPQPHHLGKPSERRQDRISTVFLVLVSVNGHKRDISYYHEKAFRIGMSKSPRKSFNRKSSSARQWKQNKKKDKNWRRTEGIYERYDRGSLPSKAKRGKTI